MRTRRRALLAVAALLTTAGVSCLARRRLADTLTRVFAQRPTGPGARLLYGARRAEYDGLDSLLEALALRGTDRLLEIGPGGGLLVEAALPRCAHVTAIDHSPEMLGLTAGRNRGALASERLRLVEADASDLPLPDASVDVAATSDVLLVVPDATAMLAEIARVLVPGGRLVLQTRSPHVRAAMRAVGLGWMAGRMRFYEDEELTAQLDRAGFEDIGVFRDERASAQLAVARTRLLGAATVGR